MCRFHGVSIWRLANKQSIYPCSFKHVSVAGYCLSSHTSTTVASFSSNASRIKLRDYGIRRFATAARHDDIHECIVDSADNYGPRAVKLPQPVDQRLDNVNPDTDQTHHNHNHTSEQQDAEFRSNFLPESSSNTLHGSSENDDAFSELFEQSEVTSLEEDIESTIQELFLGQLQNRSVRPKVDLSYQSPRKREAQSHERIFTRSMPATSFRSNNGLRRILAKFVRKIYVRLLQAPAGASEETGTNIERYISGVFSDRSLISLRQRGYDVEDVLSWSWVLTAKTPNLRVRRYIALTRDNQERGETPIPWLVCLQLLRMEVIDAVSLRMLWDEIMKSLTRNEPRFIDQDSAAIMLVRFTRHARVVDVALYENISIMAPRILSNNSTDQEQTVERLQRLTHLYNRLLTLLSLPTPTQPFLSVSIQQRAQLNIAQYMYESKPQIQISREGYQAFIKLQLRHKKTAAEQDWARTKGKSWPPWRQDQLGIQATLEYPGQQSRVMKVLQRMREAGYSPTEYELSAQVMAGWDTDMSPTIQVRRLMNTKPISWMRNKSFPDKTQAAVSEHAIWAARVEATRSVREAWSCFYSYMQITRHGERKLEVYTAMFDKMLAKVVTDDSLSMAVPGDGREVSADPVATRDLIYVPVDPLSIDELYAQMLGEGLRPAGRLLASLLDGSATLAQGFDYIQDSSMNEIKKDVLRHAEKYPPLFIQDTIAAIPNYLFASFIRLLFREVYVAEKFLHWPSSQSSSNASMKKGLVSSYTYGSNLLELSCSTYIPAYNARLNMIRDQTTMVRKDLVTNNYKREKSIRRLWKSLLSTLDLMHRNDVAPDMMSFRMSANIVQNALAVAPRLFMATLSDTSVISSFAKTLFLKSLRCDVVSTAALQSRSTSLKTSLLPAKTIRSDLLPDCKDLEIMFFILAVTNDVESTLDLLEWMHEGVEVLTFPRSHDKGRRQMMAAARAALEVSWFKGPSNLVVPASNDQIEVAQSYCAVFEWASDEDVLEYLLLREDWFARIGQVIHSRQNIEPSPE